MRLQGRAPHETGIHPSAECLAHHGGILKGSLTEDHQGFVRGGFLFVYDSSLDLLTSDMLSFPRNAT
jgi:hypothetical protein